MLLAAGCLALGGVKEVVSRACRGSRRAWEGDHAVLPVWAAVRLRPLGLACLQPEVHVSQTPAGGMHRAAHKLLVTRAARARARAGAEVSPEL